ncbi:CRISPR-associated endonuclease Cas1 [Leptotrichia wadei]|uniref:CRISPR-associated endonuclease Cas1 n=1 Tax=Leptotrichia wadei TaxID=157687 RepID=A0A510KVC0_9FUSO|nr:CRISPR-associated endonuclease Cas1 [Leptotrichia wadei]
MYSYVDKYANLKDYYYDYTKNLHSQIFISKIIKVCTEFCVNG